MSQYTCTRCGEEFQMNKPTNFALALQEHHDCPDYEYDNEDDGVLAEKIPPEDVENKEDESKNNGENEEDLEE